jgi:hypothetical protein
MKKFTGYLIIAFIAFSCKSEQSHPKSDLNIANLKGNVWKIDRTIHDTKNKCACALKTECNESKYEYDSKGNLLESYTIDENGSTNDSSKYIYDRHGVCSEIIKFSGKKLIGKEIPVFERERVIGVKIFNENGKIESIINYVYSGSEISEEKTRNGNGEVVSTVQKESLNGQVVSQIEKDSNGNMLNVSKFKRNVNNDIIECLFTVTKDNKEYKITYEYDYDSAGNWIKQTKFFDSQIVNIMVRNIEYFKV